MKLEIKSDNNTLYIDFPIYLNKNISIVSDINPDLKNYKEI